MKLSLTHKRKLIYVAVLMLAALLAIAGCADIQPYNPPNHREEGPEKGLFTGSRGAWEITLPEASQAGGEEDKNAATDTETERKEKKSPDESADGMQQ